MQQRMPPSVMRSPEPRSRLLGVPRRVAAVAALAQVVALAPGVSRSGAVLVALRMWDVGPFVAQRFSYVSSLPITAGAAGLTLLRADRAAVRAEAAALVVGATTAAAAAYVTVGLRRGRPGLTGPAVYRLAVAAVVVARLCRKGRPWR